VRDRVVNINCVEIPFARIVLVVACAFLSDTHKNKGHKQQTYTRTYVRNKKKKNKKQRFGVSFALSLARVSLRGYIHKVKLNLHFKLDLHLYRFASKGGDIKEEPI
jgi:hypothetical protein